MSPDDGVSTSGRPIAFVMLDRAEFPDIAILIKAIGHRIAGFTSLGPYKTKQEGGLIGHVDGKRCVVYDQPNALDADASCIKSAWWWRDAWDRLQPRKAHVAVSMLDSDAPRHGYRVIAKLAAAVIETSPAIGILWDAADAVWPADRFRTAVDQAGEDVPVEMLVSVKLAADDEYSRPDGGRTCFALTWGLAAFGLMEIEVRGFDGPPDELVSTMLNMAAYLIKSGATISHGHTIGHDELTSSPSTTSCRPSRPAKPCIGFI
jgi:hypothetical protein